MFHAVRCRGSGGLVRCSRAGSCAAAPTKPRRPPLPASGIRASRSRSVSSRCTHWAAVCWSSFPARWGGSGFRSVRSAPSTSAGVDQLLREGRVHDAYRAGDSVLSSVLGLDSDEIELIHEGVATLTSGARVPSDAHGSTNGPLGSGPMIRTNSPPIRFSMVRYRPVRSSSRVFAVSVPQCSCEVRFRWFEPNFGV